MESENVMDIRKNTVSAENQMKNSSELSFLGNRNAKKGFS